MERERWIVYVQMEVCAVATHRILYSRKGVRYWIEEFTKRL